jgi:uncharacterized protein YjbI with pentapeptide repeats
MNDKNYENVKYGYIVRFDKANLKYAMFDHVWIGAASFYQTCLAGARFWDADLSRADFSTADFGDERTIKGCVAIDPDHRERNAKIDFTDARLIKANLSGKDVSGYNFRGANISGAIFKKANISGADFSQAKNTESADFTEACTERDKPAIFPNKPKIFPVCQK